MISRTSRSGKVQCLDTMFAHTSCFNPFLHYKSLYTVGLMASTGNRAVKICWIFSLNLPSNSEFMAGSIHVVFLGKKVLSALFLWRVTSGNKKERREKGK